MPRSLFIHLTTESKQQQITYQEIRELLNYYSSMLKNTGKQLNWKYDEASFPYDIQERHSNGSPYLYLEGTCPENYHSLLLGIHQDETTKQHNVQITLSTNSTFGDKAKAIEFAKFLAKKLKGELHLFNERIIYYTKIKV